MDQYLIFGFSFILPLFSISWTKQQEAGKTRKRWSIRFQLNICGLYSTVLELFLSLFWQIFTFSFGEIWSWTRP